MARLLQWNCRGLVSKWAENKMFFLLLAPIIIALQETWLLPTDPYTFTLFNYSLYRNDETEGERRHGGVALYINNDYVHSQIPLNTTLQAVACTVRLNGRNMDICSLYLPPSIDNNTLETNLNHLVSQFHHPFLLLGDFNAHNPMWGRDATASDERGDIIERFLDAHHLVLLNTGQNTHFSLSHNSESAIDLSICSPQLSVLFEWSVDSDIYNSDHYPIKLQTTFSPEDDEVRGSVPRWNLQRADWVKFQQFCNIDYEQFISPEQGIKFLTDTILAAAEATVPMTSSAPTRIRVPWWSQQVKQAIAKRKRLFRAYLRHRNNATLLIRNKERARCQKIIREARRASWKSFLGQLNYRTPLSKIWNLVRSLSGKRSFPSLPILRVNNTSITDPRTIVNTIAQTLVQHSSSQSYPPGFLDYAPGEYRLSPDAFTSNNAEYYNTAFSLSELQDVIYSTGHTSVGPDKLHYDFLRHIPESAIRFILRTFNDLWLQHIFPEAWKEAIVIAIPKPGKNHQDPSNYRPISLTSCLGKIFERMVGRRLEWFLEENNLLSAYQSGFRKHHSTLDHVIRLETDIRKGFKFKKHTTAVFLDIARAYDMVYRPALLTKLHTLGVRGHLAYYLVGFLTGNRRFQLRFRSMFSDVYSLENGLPQGSCLSPMLFNIMINDLFDTLQSGISYSLFADDCAIWCTDKYSQHSIPRLQNALNALDEWSKRNGCIFSPNKSAVVVFTKHTRMPQPTDLFISGNVIPRFNSFKFLGIVLDSRLSMTKHIQHIKVKCSKRLNLFRCIAGTDFGADRATLLQLYKSLVLPIIEYGSAVYAGGSENTLKRLEVIQNTFIRIATGAMKTSPIPSLQVDAFIAPLTIRRIEQTLRYASKLMFHPTHSTYGSLSVLPSIHHNYVGPAEKRSGLTIASRLKKFSTDINYIQPQIIPLPPLVVPPWERRDWEVSFLIDFPKSLLTDAEIQQRFLHMQRQYSDYKFIYTDGSKHDNRVSNAIFTNNEEPQLARLPDGTSIFIAELHAILRALELAAGKSWQKVLICTDSRSAVQSLLAKYPSSHLLISIYNLLHHMASKGQRIRFIWIPGHRGILGNIQADKFAKDALALAEITDIPTDYQSIKSSIRQAVLLKWQQQWSEVSQNSMLRYIKPKIQNWTSSNRTNRREEKVLARMRLGHTPYTHSYIYSRDARPTCARCQCPLTVEHILINCSHFVLERRQLTHFCMQQNIPFTLPYLLGDANSGLLDMLFTFLRHTKLIEKL